METSRFNKYIAYFCHGCGETLSNTSTHRAKNHLVFDGKIRMEFFRDGYHSPEFLYLNRNPTERLYVCDYRCLEKWAIKRQRELERERERTTLDRKHLIPL